MAKILAIDDEQSVLNFISDILTRSRHECAQAQSAAQAREAMSGDEFDLVLVDIHLQDGSGLQLLDDIHRMNPQAGIMMVSGIIDIEIAKTSIEKGAWAYITKPFGPNDLIINVVNCLRRRELEKIEREHQRLLREQVKEKTNALVASEIRFRDLVETMQEGLATIDAEGRITYVNNRVADLTGKGKKELLGRMFSDVFPDSGSGPPKKENKNTGTVSFKSFEVPFTDTEGRPMCVIASPTPIYDVNGAGLGTQVVLTDITDRKKMENEIKSTRERLGLFLDTIAAGVLVVDQKTSRIVSANPPLLKMIQAREKDVIGHRCFRFVCPNDEGDCPIMDRGQEVDSSERTLVRSDGTEIPILKTVAALSLGEEKLLIETCVDISNLVEARNALKKSEADYRTVVENVNSIIMRIDTQGRITFFNNYALDFFGYTREEILGRPVLGTITPQKESTGRSLEKFIHELTQAPELFSYNENENIKSNGERCWVAWTNKTILDEQGNLKEIFSVGTDITEKKSIEEASRRDRERLFAVLEACPDPLLIYSQDGLLEYCNRAFEEIFGWKRDEIKGKRIATYSKNGRETASEREKVEHESKWVPILPESEVESSVKMVDGLLKGVKVLGLEVKRMTKDGRILDMILSASNFTTPSGEPDGFVAIFKDITEQKKLDAQLRQAQKLESIGQLAAGIAHEINTPIQYIGDNTRFLRETLDDLVDLIVQYRNLAGELESGGNPGRLLPGIKKKEEEADLEYVLEESPLAVEQSLEGLNRVAEIVRAMKEFSHPGGKEKSLVDLNRALESTAIVSKNEYKYVADLKLDLDPDLPAVQALPGELNQVFLNLIVNAAHAIEEKTGEDDNKGLITVSTKTLDDAVQVTISDTGPGIPDEIVHRIFDPFFTTKEPGKGTGQGLAIAYSVIVDKHGGKIEVQTGLGKGTAFVIRLPIESRNGEPEQ